MNLQDLTENRERIMKNIKKQSSEKEAIVGVMNKMVAWLNSREDIQEMKPTMGNVDKFTSMCIASWIKNDYKPIITEEWLEHREQVKWETISL